MRPTLGGLLTWSTAALCPSCGNALTLCVAAIPDGKLRRSFPEVALEKSSFPVMRATPIWPCRFRKSHAVLLVPSRDERMPGLYRPLPAGSIAIKCVLCFWPLGPKKSGPQRRLFTIAKWSPCRVRRDPVQAKQTTTACTRHAASLFRPILPGCGLSAVPDAAAAGSRRLADRIRGEAGGEQDGDQRRRPSGKAATTFQKFAAILLAVCPEFFGLNGKIEIPVRSAITPGIHQARNDHCRTSAAACFPSKGHAVRDTGTARCGWIYSKPYSEGGNHGCRRTL